LRDALPISPTVYATGNSTVFDHSVDFGPLESFSDGIAYIAGSKDVTSFSPSGGAWGPLEQLAGWYQTGAGYLAAYYRTIGAGGTGDWQAEASNGFFVAVSLEPNPTYHPAPDSLTVTDHTPGLHQNLRLAPT